MVLLYIAGVSVEGVTNQIMLPYTPSYIVHYFIYLFFFIVFSTGIVRVTFQYYMLVIFISLLLLFSDNI